MNAENAQITRRDEEGIRIRAQETFDAATRYLEKKAYRKMWDRYLSANDRTLRRLQREAAVAAAAEAAVVADVAVLPFKG